MHDPRIFGLDAGPQNVLSSAFEHDRMFDVCQVLRSKSAFKACRRQVDARPIAELHDDRRDAERWRVTGCRLRDITQGKGAIGIFRSPGNGTWRFYLNEIDYQSPAMSTSRTCNDLHHTRVGRLWLDRMSENVVDT